MREKLNLSCDHLGLAGLTPPPPHLHNSVLGRPFHNKRQMKALWSHLHNITSPHSRYTRLILVVALAMANQKVNALWT